MEFTTDELRTINEALGHAATLMIQHQTKHATGSDREQGFKARRRTFEDVWAKAQKELDLASLQKELEANAERIDITS